MKMPLLYFDRLAAWTGFRPSPRALPGTHSPTFLHRPAPRHARPTRPYPSRSFLGIVFLLGLSLVAAGWNAHPQLPRSAQAPGIDLRAEAPRPKVNVTSAELPAPPVRLVEHETFKVELSPAPPTPQPEPPPAPLPPQLPVVQVPPELPIALPAPPVIEEPKALVPPQDYGPGSVACSCFRDLQPGDTPMMRNWNVLKLTSLMAVAMAVAPLPAANPPAGPTEYGMGDIKELKDAIEALNKKLGEMVKSTNDGFAGLKIDM